LAQGLHDLGLLPVPVAEALDKESMLYWRWSLHGVSHHLGIDVHDCAQARREKYRDGTIEEGYVFTVEPGLYFQEDDELVPAELRGIGVRIEDDILVTADGPENLSAGLPRHPDEVENWVAEQRELGFRLPG
jgi:Xaa-Pro aminopeptidase